MTVLECYERAVGFLPEVKGDNAEMQKHMVTWANVLIADTINAENIYRRANGIEELSTPPKVAGRNDEIPYNEKLVAMAFPYGMARWVFRENDDVSGSREYYSLYAEAVAEATPVIYGDEVEDYYR